MKTFLSQKARRTGHPASFSPLA